MEAVIFPGQGAQYSGMGKSLYDSYPKARDIFDKANDICDIDLSGKCFNGPDSDLKDTSIQQLAILVTSLAAFEVFKEKGKSLGYLSGLSLGEYSCLYAAGVLSLNDVIVLVKERALAMQRAASINPSTMLAVLGLEPEDLREKGKKDGFYIANLNAPGQVVVSLGLDDKSKVKGSLEAMGAKVIELAVSGGFHSPFMEPAAQQLKKVIEKLSFNDAQIPIVSNVTAKAYKDKETIRENLIKQLVSPVLWQGCVEFMAGEGVGTFFEVGPSKVLRGLMRKINSQLKVVNIEKKEDLEGV